MSWRPRALALTAAALLAAGPTACSDSGSGQDGKQASRPGFPYTVTNCGVRTTYEAPPERAVTMNQHVTEIMLALGLEKSLVGTAYLDDSIAPAYRKAYERIPVLAEEYPGKEKLLAADPDFVYGGYSSAFAGRDGRARDDLAKSGIDTRLNTENCLKGAAGLDDLYREVEQVGRTFGVPDRAEAWNAKARATVAAAAKTTKDARPVSVFVYDSGDKAAFTAGGKGIGNDLITRAGGRNVFADLDKSFGDVSWEQVVDRRPEVVVIYDYGSTTVAQKKKRLLEDPALRDVPAIRNKRFAVMPLSDTVLGVRVPDALTRLAGQLHPASGR
ncbi:ABC transporter [Streptomyces albus]|uniref:ABC transporter n=1 Tax=Streptomyces albus (strain ATCC 21838 / DSM 41398 / FERM P-419 / JCM 4703 / NBRC 107858) TaxID=1081613 RepID=A0A0B5EVZ0_STRA4|nr:ABC transporter [Streptomyces albus]AOU77143.1 ABC transporter (iron.B12.siderophore.hemin), periplasmic substrate-binding component [Streptomyces albus]AYN32921.1 lipoprotein [Streptomyces albus]